MLTGQTKKDYQREYMRRYRSNKGLTGSNKVNTQVSVRPKSLDLGQRGEENLSETDKKSVIVDLREKIDNIKPSEITEKHYCLQCQALGRRSEAIGEYEVVSDDGEHRCWLCRQHARGRELSRV